METAVYGDSVELESAVEEADADALTQTESLQEPQGETEPASPEDENPTEPEEKEPVVAGQEERSETPVPDEPAEGSREEGSDDPDNGHQED